MEELERRMVGVLAVRDCPAVRRLLLDLWGYAQQHGEAAGLELAACLHAGVMAYQGHQDRIRGVLRMNT